MKYVEELRDKYKGENIWVIGCGESIDAYPCNWWKNNVCIGMNWGFSAFQDVGDGLDKFQTKDYYSVHAHKYPPDYIAKQLPEYLKTCIILLPPKRRAGIAWWEDYNDDPYYMRWGLRGGAWGNRATAQEFKVAVDCMMRGGDKCEYVSRGTTLHWAIQVAALMGGKTIRIAGAEGVGGHMKEHGSFYHKKYPQSGVHPRGFYHQGTKYLTDALRPHGVEVIYYYYGKGNRKP